MRIYIHIYQLDSNNTPRLDSNNTPRFNQT